MPRDLPAFLVAPSAGARAAKRGARRGSGPEAKPKPARRGGGGGGGFFEFMREFRAKFKESHPEAGVTDVAKAGGAAWRALDEGEKERYKAAARARSEANSGADGADRGRKRARAPDRGGAIGAMGGRASASLAAAVDRRAAGPQKRARKPSMPVRRRRGATRPDSPDSSGGSGAEGAEELAEDAGLLSSQLSDGPAASAPRAESPPRESVAHTSSTRPVGQSTAGGEDEAVRGEDTAAAAAPAPAADSGQARAEPPVVSLASLLEDL